MMEINYGQLLESVMKEKKKTGNVPKRIRVRFGDGTVAEYALQVEQPKPNVFPREVEIRGNITIGYAGKTEGWR